MTSKSIPRKYMKDVKNKQWVFQWRLANRSALDIFSYFQLPKEHMQEKQSDAY